MIRRLPRFDDGTNPFDYYTQLTINLPDVYIGPYNPAVGEEYARSGIMDPNLSYDIDPRIQAMSDALLQELNQQKTTSSTGIRPMSARPKRPAKVTTAAQDIKAAETARNKAIASAKKKAAAEEKDTRSAARKAEIEAAKARSAYWSTVLRNQKAGLTSEVNPKTGERVYSAYANMQAGATGRKKTPAKRAVSTAVGLFGNIASNGFLRGVSNYLYSTYAANKLSKAKFRKMSAEEQKTNKKRVQKRNKGWNAYTLGQW